MAERFNKKPRKSTQRQDNLAFAVTAYGVDVANTQFDSEKDKEGGNGEKKTKYQ